VGLGQNNHAVLRYTRKERRPFIDHGRRYDFLYQAGAQITQDCCKTGT
jgi:hypothetical protein